MSFTKLKTSVKRLQLTDGQAAWDDISAKPAEFTPVQHGHTQSEISGLVSDLAGKQPSLESGTNIKTINGATVLGAGNLAVSAAETFESVSKNLLARDATLAYSGGDLTTITYTGGIVKTFNYSGSDLVSVVLSGPTPGGIDLTKALSYSGGNLVGVAYT